MARDHEMPFNSSKKKGNEDVISEEMLHKRVFITSRRDVGVCMENNEKQMIYIYIFFVHCSTAFS